MVCVAATTGACTCYLDESFTESRTTAGFATACLAEGLWDVFAPGVVVGCALALFVLRRNPATAALCGGNLGTFGVPLGDTLALSFGPCGDIATSRELFVDLFAVLCAFFVGGAPVVGAGASFTGTHETTVRGAGAMQGFIRAAGARVPTTAALVVGEVVSVATVVELFVGFASVLPGDIPAATALPGGFGPTDFGPAHEIRAFHLGLFVDFALIFPAGVALALGLELLDIFALGLPAGVVFALGFPLGVLFADPLVLGFAGFSTRA